MAIPMPVRDSTGMQMPPQFDPDGKAYLTLDNGQKQYIPPNVAAAMAKNDPMSDPRLARYAQATPAPSDAGGEGGEYFDSKTGTWKDTGNKLLKLTTLGAGGIIAAPFIAGALGAGGAAGASGSSIPVATGASAPAVGSVGATVPGVGAAAAAGGKMSILGTLGKLAPILGGAAKNRAASQAATDQNNIARDSLNLSRYEDSLKAPATRMATSAKASMLANAKPVTASWGGPGSGLRGETVHYNGGYNDPNLISPDTRALAQDTVHNELMDSMAPGGGGPPAATPPTGGGAIDDLLGYGATGASALAALIKGNGASKPGAV